MLTCKGLVARSSDLLDGSLSIRQRMSVRTHLALCRDCRRFVQQLRVSQQVIRTMPDEAHPDSEALLKTLSAQRAVHAASRNQP